MKCTVQVMLLIANLYAAAIGVPIDSANNTIVIGMKAIVVVVVVVVMKV
jgi:hypothetical protein